MKKGMMLVMVNFVCGCVGGIVRLVVYYFVYYDKRFDQFVIVFVGQDKEVIV